MHACITQGGRITYTQYMVSSETLKRRRRMLQSARELVSKGLCRKMRWDILMMQKNWHYCSNHLLEQGSTLQRTNQAMHDKVQRLLSQL